MLSVLLQFVLCLIDYFFFNWLHLAYYEGSFGIQEHLLSMTFHQFKADFGYRELYFDAISIQVYYQHCQRWLRE